MKNLILTIIFALAALTMFTASESKASVLTNGQSSLQVSGDTYVYVKVCENGVWFIYTYTTDGIFVAKTEQI